MRRRDAGVRFSAIDGSTGSQQPVSESILYRIPLNDQCFRRHGIEAPANVNPLSKQIADALNNLDAVWVELFPAERARIVSLLI